MPARRLVLIVAIAACAGVGAACGDTEAGAPAPAATPTEEHELAALAERYVHAVAAQDWKAACATRSRRDIRTLERLGGTCEEAYAALLGEKPVELFRDAEARDVRIRGDLAGIDLHQPGQDEPATTLAAVREGGRWLLQDTPDERTP